MKQISVLFFLAFSLSVFGQQNENQTLNYDELIKVYKNFAQNHDEIELYMMGESDYGLPIYLCILNGAQDSIKTFEKARKGTTVLINNAIHPGEPDGVNACISIVNDWIENGKIAENAPCLAIIPAYNVGGMMVRNGSSRANQNGPEEYGFRGNAKNLDLNRDCVKMDSKNMFTFAKIFHSLDPDVFLDTHVSNGADYQYTMTYIAAMRERMAPVLGTLMYDELIPALKDGSKEKGFELVPYVDTKGETPESGIVAFNDLPRYIMGYASMMNAISFTLETHMLKPFPERVQATKVFIVKVLDWVIHNGDKLEQARNEAIEWEDKQKWYKYNFQLTDKLDSISFNGYAFTHPISEVTGLKRLKYHRDQPYTKQIPYYHHYQAKDSVLTPKYFIIGKQNEQLIERLVANNFVISRLKKDTVMELTVTKINQFETVKTPYEGHFLHSGVESVDVKEVMELKKGDVVIYTNQRNKRYLMSLLESCSEDSFFAWNFFDSYVQQKEYFSPYVFEDQALEIVNNNPELKRKLEEKKLSDTNFKMSSWAQLYFIYQHSNMYEPSHNRLPVFKVF